MEDPTKSPLSPEYLLECIEAYKGSYKEGFETGGFIKGFVEALSMVSPTIDQTVLLQLGTNLWSVHASLKQQKEILIMKAKLKYSVNFHSVDN